MWRVLSLLKPYRKWMGIAWFLMLIELIVELWQPLLMEKIINQGIIKNHLPVIWKWGAVMIATSLLAFAAGITNSFAAAYVGQQFGFDVRKRLFMKIQSCSLPQVEQFSTASLITRMTNDVTQMQNMVFMSLRIMLRAPLLIIFGMVMALIVQARLTFILTVFVPFLLLFLIWAMKKAAERFSRVQQALDRVNRIMRENMANMRLIKAFVRSPYEQQRFRNENETLMAQTMTVSRFVEAITPVLLFFMNAAIIVILFIGKKEIPTGEVNAGEVVAVINYTTRMTAALSIFTFVTMAFSRARASGRRIAELFEIPANTEEKTHHAMVTRGALEFVHVSFRYPASESFVLRDVSFSVRANETVAILGETGAGKSSLLQLIPRLYEVTEGTIFIDGIDVRHWDEATLRASIGFVPQELLLFSGTIRENICFGRNVSEEEMIQAAKAAQIHDAIMSFPNQYDTIVGQKGVTLSGGQKQRIAIARALIRKPKLLLLDDCMSALDAKTEANVWRALKAYDCTTLIVTQKITTAMEADTILLLKDGNLLAKGTHQQLLNNELYRQIVQSQLGKKGMSYAPRTP